jgi:hypothetical protein
MDNRLRDNAFYRNPENLGLYEHSINMNNGSINCIEQRDNTFNNGLLGYRSNEYNPYNNKCIRNVDHERPLMFPQYRFKHLNYCHPVNLNGYLVCKSCSSSTCSFNRHISQLSIKNNNNISPTNDTLNTSSFRDKDLLLYKSGNTCYDFAPARS